MGRYKGNRFRCGLWIRVILCEASRVLAIFVGRVICLCILLGWPQFCLKWAKYNLFGNGPSIINGGLLLSDYFNKKGSLNAIFHIMSGSKTLFIGLVNGNIKPGFITWTGLLLFIFFLLDLTDGNTSCF